MVCGWRLYDRHAWLLARDAAVVAAATGATIHLVRVVDLSPLRSTPRPLAGALRLRPPLPVHRRPASYWAGNRAGARIQRPGARWLARDTPRAILVGRYPPPWARSQLVSAERYLSCTTGSGRQEWQRQLQRFYRCLDPTVVVVAVPGHRLGFLDPALHAELVRLGRVLRPV